MWQITLDWLVKFGAAAVVLAIVQWLLNRRKTSAETQSIHASTDKTRVDTILALSGRVGDMIERAAAVERAIEDTRKRHDDEVERLARQARFLRLQVEHFEEAEKVNRERTHALGNELNKLALWIALPEPKSVLTLRTSEEILKPFPLPTPPKLEG